ncbi:MAG TPA: diguanylate cyclase [Dehalococcoidia bacterium]|jgi:diguanylate cyclase (GGDEF)-like protein|nr:diguanylate cyclase [Dehalococcoidia bacterium]
MEEQSYRRLGLSDLPPLPWGSHIAYLYESREDLLEVLVPYFKAGLEDGEGCLWVATPALTVEETREALARAIPNLAQPLAKGQLSILDHRDLYLKGGRFGWEGVLHHWLEREAQALSQGYRGLRVSGSPGWLERGDWASWIAYERAKDEGLAQHRVIALCTYSLRQFSPDEIAQAVNSHRYTLVRKDNRWQLTEPILTIQAARALVGRAQQLEAMKNLVDAIGKSLSTEAVAEQALEQTLDLMGGDCGAVLMPNYRGQRPKFVAVSGLPPHLIRQIEQSNQFKIHLPRLAQLQDIWAVDDVDLASLLGDEERSAIRQENINSFVVVPLLSRGKSLGIMAIGFRTRHTFTPEEQTLLSMIGSQVTIALERAREHEQLRRQVIRDPLTGLFNRRYFNEVLKREVGRAKRYQRPLSLALLDINNFKRYNDRHGHLEGDLALQSLARRLRAAIRSTDIPCRYGGDELIVVLPETAKPEATAVAKRIQKAIASKPFRKGKLTISFGVATCPEDSSEPRRLMGAADRALYRAGQPLP